MKKSIFAIAAATAFSGAAYAQSSVTVYGLVDGGFQQFKAEYNNTVINKQNSVAFGSNNGAGNLSGSRLGFRGVEDIGGGNTVGFVLETGINYINQTLATTTATHIDQTAASNGIASTGTALFGAVRQGYLSINNKVFGSLRVGTQESLAKGIEMFDPQGGPNLVGTANLYTQGLVTRYSQAFTYLAPNIGGIDFALQTTIDGTPTSEGSTTASSVVPTGNRSTSIRAIYNQGPIAAGAVYEKRSTFGVATGSTNGITPVAITGIAATVVPEINHYGIGASYDFKVIKPSVYYFNTKAVNSSAAASAGKNSGTLIGLTAPFSTATTGTVAYTMGKSDNNNATIAYDTKGLQAVVTHSLSKRSNIYGGYGTVAWNTKYSATALDVKYSMMTIGMRHSF